MHDETRTTNSTPPENVGGPAHDTSDRLESWKDVATYLRRNVSTVQRWESREGLPIHRHLHDKQGSVYAFRRELDAWRQSRLRADTADAQEARSADSTAATLPEPRSDAAFRTLPALVRIASSRRRVITIMLLVALVAAAVAASRFVIEPAASPEISSLVVLPLADLSSDTSHEYVAAGLTEALTTRLAGLGSLRVVSRTSAMAFEGRRASMQEIRQLLGVDAALEGSVLYQSGQVKVSIRLIHAPTDAHLWTRDFEADAAELLRLEGDVARAVAEALGVRLLPHEQARLAAAPIVDPRAHEEYLLGRYLLWKFIEEDRLRAIEHFKRAIHIAPDYAPPYAGLAHAWWMRGVLGPLSLNDVAEPARDAAREALARDDRLAEAYAAQAYVQGMFDWNWTGAEATINRALRFDRNSVDVRYVYALLLMAMGRMTDAVTQIEHAAQLDPLSAQVQSTFGRILYRARRFDEAIARLNRAIELEPRNSGAYARIGQVYLQLERYEDALRAFEKMHTLDPDSSNYNSQIARAYAGMGRTTDARSLLATLPSQMAAAVHVALGDHDAAFAVLFDSLENREDWHMFVKADPGFDSLHRDPRWTELLHRMNLASN
jgi:TolB-like protein/Tfp pilus assembly protein PilF